MTVWLALSAALAYESDTLTDRVQPLPDASAELDAFVNEVIAEAIDWTNERSACADEPEEMHRLLARAIHARTAADELVLERGGLRAFGFDRVSAWVEKGGVPRRDFLDRRDLFASATVKEAPLLAWAGVCSTIRVGDVLVGTDKLDHFFEEGYDGWRRAEKGVDRAVDWATRTENGKYGLEASETFSYGDLRADWDGLWFYDTLLEEGGVATIGADGCLAPTERFTWGDWVTWEYDEVMNPPVFTPETEEAVARHLRENRDDYCADWAVWGGPAYLDHLDQVLAARPEYASEEAPERTDPYRLDEICEGWTPPRDELTPRR